MYHYQPRKLHKNTQEPCAQDSILLIGQLGFIISLNPHQQHSSSHPTHSHSCFCGVENWCFEIRSEFLFSTTQECQKTCSKFKDVDSSNFRNTSNSHKRDSVLRNFQAIIFVDDLLPGQCWPPHCNKSRIREGQSFRSERRGGFFVLMVKAADWSLSKLADWRNCSSGSLTAE